MLYMTTFIPQGLWLEANASMQKFFADLLIDASLKDDVKILLTSSREAEAIKLFSNTYLALRVAFFNELDTYAMSKGLDSNEYNYWFGFR